MTAPTIPPPLVGQELPSQVRVTSRTQLVRYAGAAHDPSPIHFDDGYAARRGFPSVIVHGFLKAGFLADLALDWAPAGSWIQAFAARYRGIDLVGTALTCQGRVTDLPSPGVVALELWIEGESGRTTTTAQARVRWGHGDPSPQDNSARPPKGGPHDDVHL